MREILFKAKRLDNGEWVEGYYYTYKTLECFSEGREYHYILNPGFADWSMPRPTEFYKIDPNTLCQFTGLVDKDGNKIWENDIVDVDVYDCWWNPIINAERNLIKWDESKSGFYPYVWYSDEYNMYYHPEASEVIGNKFDNPEML